MRESAVVGTKQASRADPLKALGGTRRAYVIEPYKVLYISTAKNACTSIKWLIADLAGEQLDDEPMGLFPSVSHDQIVHRRSAFKNTKRLNELTPEVRSSISPDNGWFVFSVVRDPRARVFSAWQNKYLAHNPSPFYRRWADEPWYPGLATSNEQIIASFGAFVDLMRTNPDHDAFADAHFRSQTFLLAQKRVPYSTIYEISELGTMVKDLETHVRANGWQGDQLAMRNVNDTPLKPYAEVFAEPVRSTIEQFYAADFAQFGARWDFGKYEQVPEWDERQLAAVRQNALVNERVAELLDMVERANTRARRAKEIVTAQLIQRTLPNRAKRRLRREVAARRAALALFWSRVTKSKG